MIHYVVLILEYNIIKFYAGLKTKFLKEVLSIIILLLVNERENMSYCNFISRLYVVCQRRVRSAWRSLTIYNEGLGFPHEVAYVVVCSCRTSVSCVALAWRVNTRFARGEFYRALDEHFSKNWYMRTNHMFMVTLVYRLFMFLPQEMHVLPRETVL